MLRRFNASGNSLSVRYRWKTASQNYRRLLSPLIHHDHHQNARHLTSIPTVVLPPIVFGGLVVALWTWKCVMMVVFQNKIIYMPGLPPNARRETIEDYENQCGGIVWTKEKTVASDGTEISLCVSTVETGSDASRLLYILYFQGEHFMIESYISSFDGYQEMHLRCHLDYHFCHQYFVCFVIKLNMHILSVTRWYVAAIEGTGHPKDDLLNLESCKIHRLL